ncbi:MAG: hypothetical protein IJC84_07000 [Clostridia bacterium]|nr:hypothetical protein [Clostridia bacterium]
MAIKDYTKELMQRLQDGTQAIRARYEALTKKLKSDRLAEENALAEETRALKNAAAARSRIALQGELEQMADSGYLQSGEAVQARMAENARAVRAQSQIDSDAARSLDRIRSEYTEAALTLGEGEARELSSLRADTVGALRDEVKEQRETAEREAERAHEKELVLLRSSGADTAEGIEPKKSAYDYVDDVVKSATRYVPSKGYRVVDRKAILQRLSSLIRDEGISKRYRYEMYLYGKSLGYLS